jgi:hypothetical protein
MHILSYASLQMRNHVQPRLAQCLVYVRARAKPECQGGYIGTLLAFLVAENIQIALPFQPVALLGEQRGTRRAQLVDCSCRAFAPPKTNQRQSNSPLCRLKFDKKIVYTSRFVRVILAQGPC